MKTLSTKLGALIVVVIILAVGFYWYELRPASIREYCAKNTKDLLTGIGQSEEEYQTNYPFYYSKCLNSKGLKE